MPIDPQSVRVDLLKIKRKLYISYPEGSKERQDFIYASKLSELSYLQKLMDPEVVEVVFEEYEHRVKTELLNILISLALGGSFSSLMFGFHLLHPTNIWLSLYLIPGLVGVAICINHIKHLIDNWRGFQPFRKEYKTLSARIDKLLNELKGFKK